MTTATKREPFLFRVAAGTRAVPCDKCPATIYFIETASGKVMPVDCSVVGGRAPTATEEGRGLSHFATCPAAAFFRRKS